MKKIGVTTLIAVLLLLVAFSVSSFSKDKSVDEVMHTMQEKYDIQGYIVGKEPATIDVDLNNEEDIEKVKKYIMSNMSDEDLSQYEINVFSGWDKRLE
ncbi:bacteriophage protein [Oceanobacillus picturae]|uniref:Bacteriophage protein n=1 Tax=Oceanobacillus picturae TaxID=171693 RepID=A0A0U9H2V7_9BACI|nr:hypothetical protein [Oceanobacillus picturae]GAQ16970.1 bacteriophage protein [Oceanobacillus picturae]